MSTGRDQYGLGSVRVGDDELLRREEGEQLGPVGRDDELLLDPRQVALEISRHRGELGVVPDVDEVRACGLPGDRQLVRGLQLLESAADVGRLAVIVVDGRVGQPPLQVGAFVAAEIQGQYLDDIVRLPRAALRPNSQVLIIDGDNRLRFRAVNVLRLENDYVIIDSGLENGELVNLSPIQTVVDGMRVSLSLEPTTDRG